MPNTSSPSLTFYPAYCFSLSLTHSTWARLTAANVHALKERAGFEGQNLYFHLNHPIKWIRLVGLIVSVEFIHNRVSMILDDSSGATIEIKCMRKVPPPSLNVKEIQSLDDTVSRLNNPIVSELEAATKGLTATGREIDLRGIDIGSVVKVKGGIGMYWGEKQVLLERFAICHTTTEEAAAWAENTAFRRDILDQPWVISAEDERRARRKLDGFDRERKIREEKRRKKVVDMGRKRSENGVEMRKKSDNEIEMRKREMEKEHQSKEVLERKRMVVEQREKREQEQRTKRQEEESKRSEEEAAERKREEAQERRANERKRRNEARERALRDMGAGR